MKTNRLTTRLLPLLAAFALLGSANAQTTAVPDYLSYQGRALNADGTTIGAGTPVNRTVTFRVWDHPSNGLIANLIYSEQQVVTISNGEFSALIGAGAATTGTPLGYSESTKGVPTVKISSAYNSATRYLGVTIDDGTAAVDNEISPRQQFVTSSYAFRAKVAESVDANAISSAMLATGAVGSTQLAAASVTNAKLGTNAVLTANIGDLNVTTGKIADLNVTTGKIADANVTTAKIADASVTTAKIADANITTAKLADASVTGTKIASATITAANLATGSVNSTAILDGTLTGTDIANTTIPLAALVSAVQQALSPPGTVVAYMGTTAPAGWLLCNGASVSRTTYASLYAVIGNASGSADTNSFNVPDLRGRFLRGWNSDGTGVARDPDATNTNVATGGRGASSTGGSVGNNIGSLQYDDIKAHTHPEKSIQSTATGMNVGGYNWPNNVFDTTTGTMRTAAVTPNDGIKSGNETRPANVYVNYIIKF